LIRAAITRRVLFLELVRFDPRNSTEHIAQTVPAIIKIAIAIGGMIRKPKEGSVIAASPIIKSRDKLLSIIVAARQDGAKNR